MTVHIKKKYATVLLPANRFLIVFVFLSTLFSTGRWCMAQGFSMLNFYDQKKMYHALIHSEYANQASIQPYGYYYIDSLLNHDSLFFDDLQSNYQKKYLNKILAQHLIKIDQQNLYVTIDPVFYFSYGKETNENKKPANLFRNTRGFLVQGSLGQKISFKSSFTENQAIFPEYIYNYVHKTEVVPGQGDARNFKERGHDFSWAEGALAYYPWKNLEISLGHGKFFFGDGYRSLILSDFSFFYPYLKVNFNNRFFKITRTYSTMSYGVHEIRYMAPYQRKTVTNNIYSLQLSSNLNISLFETNVWNSPDSAGLHTFELGYLNPVIFTNIFAPNNHSLVGANLRWHTFKNFINYYQFVYDTEKTKTLNTWKKIGYQAGIRYYNAFNIRNVYMQTEFNTVHPYVYSSNTQKLSYTNYNEPLAHPLGANFREWVIIGNYRYKRMHFHIKYVNAISGKDTTGANFGGNIFNYRRQDISNAPLKLLKGNRSKLNYLDANVSIIINPLYNLHFTLGYRYRARDYQSMYPNEYSQYFYISLQTNLHNFYYDF